MNLTLCVRNKWVHTKSLFTGIIYSTTNEIKCYSVKTWSKEWVFYHTQTPDQHSLPCKHCSIAFLRAVTTEAKMRKNWWHIISFFSTKWLHCEQMGLLIWTFFIRKPTINTLSVQKLVAKALWHCDLTKTNLKAKTINQCEKMCFLHKIATQEEIEVCHQVKVQSSSLCTRYSIHQRILKMNKLVIAHCK